MGRSKKDQRPRKFGQAPGFYAVKRRLHHAKKYRDVTQPIGGSDSGLTVENMMPSLGTTSTSNMHETSTAGASGTCNVWDTPLIIPGPGPAPPDPTEQPVDTTAVTDMVAIAAPTDEVIPNKSYMIMWLSY